jgi:hypothetical protein
MQMELSASMRECIEDCQDCHTLCTETIHYCLNKGGKHADPSHIILMMDCAQISQTSGDFMMRNSSLHSRTCAVCAEVCEVCAESCAKFNGDEMMQECADACRACSDSCRKMAAEM